jgi:AcrR family transcriptional regulator
MPRKPKKPYHHGDLREQLLRAGEAALQDMPFEAVSLREIARRAGVSHAAPKHHFATLGDLLGEIAARGFECFVAFLGEAVNQSRDQTAEARLTAMGRAYLAFAEANPAIYGVMFGKNDQCNFTDHLAEASRSAWAQLEAAVAAAAGPQRARDGALLVWSFVHGLSMLRLEGRLPPQLAMPQGFDASFRMIVAGLNAAA